MPEFDDFGVPLEPYLVQTAEPKLLIQEDGFSTGELPYKLVGTEDEDIARLLIEEGPDAPPDVWQKLDYHHYSLEHLGAGVWNVVAFYIGRKPIIQFDSTGGTKHITQSLNTVGVFVPTSIGGQGPDFQGAIGVEGLEVQGTDITIPVWRWQETHQWKLWEIDEDYLKMLFYNTGTVNYTPWKGYGKGEVLFLGVTGGQRGLGNVEITYHFAASPSVYSTNPNSNFKQIKMGDIIVPEKEGWHYLWARYGTGLTVDTVLNKYTVKQPESAHVEQVYYYSDFELLDIDDVQLGVWPPPGGA